MSKSEKSLVGLKIEYPSQEEARFFTNSLDFPIKDILIGITYPFPTYSVTRKATKKYFLFEYVLSGEGRVYLDGKWQKIKKGDVLFFDKDDDQDFHSIKTNPLKKIWLSFSSDYIDNMIRAFSLKTGIYSVDLSSLFINLYEISKNDALFNQSFFLICDNLHKIITELSSTGFEKNSTSQIKLKNELSGYIYKNTSLDDIASNLGISKTTLIRNFLKECGITPYQFLLLERIKVSKSLLKTTNMSVKEIAYLLCFSDEHYFSFYFKKHVGISPTQYRNK